jgi:hypothetical protein
MPIDIRSNTSVMTEISCQGCFCFLLTFPLLSISDNSQTQPERLDSDNHINLSRFILPGDPSRGGHFYYISVTHGASMWWQVSIDVCAGAVMRVYMYKMCAYTIGT